jgi:hypothetical protein
MKYQTILTLSTPKVDTLKHLSDHGLSVEFTDKRKDLIEQLRGIPYGKVVINAGASAITIWRAGDVTLTDLRLASHACMELPRHEKFTFSSHSRLRELGAHGFGVSLQAAYNSLAWRVLRRVCMGRPLESLLVPTNGADADVLHSWLKSSGWVLLGESGFRSFALSQERIKAKAKVSDEEYRLEGATREAERLTHSRAEGAKWALENAIGESKRELEKVMFDLKTLSATEPSVGQTQDEWMTSIQISCGYALIRTYGYPNSYCIPKKPAQWSHDIISANYTASVKGDTLKLSSGIVCEVPASSVLTWLKGEAATPRTRYGALERLNGRTETGEPISLIKCGCHRIDPSSLGSEWAEAMRPTHEVRHVPETPALFWHEHQAEIRERLKAVKLHQIKQTRDIVAKRILSKRNELKSAKLWDLPESVERRKTEAEAQLARMREALTELKADIAKFPSLCPLEVANSNAMAFVNTLTVRR